MKLSILPKICLLFIFSLFMFLTAHVSAPQASAEQRTCCKPNPDGSASGDCDGCRAVGIETKNNGTSCNGAANCEVCGSTYSKSNSCGGGSTSNPATCTQSIYALTNPTNLTVGQSKAFYADGRATNGIFYRMVASLTNVPAGTTPAVGTVATTSGPTCYANGNCRQGFNIVARNNGTALLKVTTQVKLCPACAVSGSCSKTYTVNVGTPAVLACKPGAACTKTGTSVTCRMPVLSTAELNGGNAAYFSECTPYKSTVALTKIAKSSTTGTFAAFNVATGVTDIKCSFKHCVTGTDSVTKCTNWGTAS